MCEAISVFILASNAIFLLLTGCYFAKIFTTHHLGSLHLRHKSTRNKPHQMMLENPMAMRHQRLKKLAEKTRELGKSANATGGGHSGGELELSSIRDIHVVFVVR